MSLEGKANRLATMLRGNLGLAMQGLSVLPVFAGYDPTSRPAGSSRMTSPAAATPSVTTTASAPARCSPAGR